MFSGGIATFASSTFTVGTPAIKAVYAGDANFKASTSAVLQQVVQVAPAPAAMVSPSSPVDAALAALQDDTADTSSLDDLAADLIAGRPRRPRVAMIQPAGAAT
jgi:Bacterial Ig-like domain (group 3)